MKITLITVTFNSAPTIADCIKSVNKQTHNNIEHIIIDAGSKDNTLEIIKSTPNRVTKIVSEPDQGIYDAMNKGIRLATGDIVGLLNSDDKFYSTTVLATINHCFESMNIDCSFGNLVYSNKDGRITRTWKSKPFQSGLFGKSWTPAHPTFYCKRELYHNYGLYKIDYKIAADVELMLRFLEVHRLKSYFIDEFLVNMLEGGVSNQGIKSTITITKELQRAFEENKLRFNLPKYFFYKGLKIKEFFQSPLKKK